MTTTSAKRIRPGSSPKISHARGSADRQGIAINIVLTLIAVLGLIGLFTDFGTYRHYEERSNARPF
jgi:hypothetical protein